MEQRQLRLGDILDDYCPRERRLTNHAVVAMVGADVKQTRCTTCEAEHEYKHGKIPRQRRKSESPAALYAQVVANAPKRVTAPLPQAAPVSGDEHGDDTDVGDASAAGDDPSLDHDEHADDTEVKVALTPEDERVVDSDVESDDEAGQGRDDEGPVHRPLIRASLPRHEGQAPPSRPIPEFTIRQPGGRPGRFRPRQQRSGQSFQGNRSNGSGPGGGFPRPGGPRPAGRPLQSRRHGPGRRRPK